MKKEWTWTDRLMTGLCNILCILIPAALLCLLLYAGQPRHLFRDDTTLTYTVKLTPVRAEYTHGIAVGDRVLDAVGKREIGEVIAYTKSPAMTETYSRSGNCLRMVEYPGHVTLTLLVRADARKTEAGYSVAGFPLTGGKRIPFRLPNFVGTGVCTAIEEGPFLS